ncbi:serine hydrolase domain-containing protein [Scytonema sp. PCC 10023]|uniref:serine hydrolase domain-containing protein n=1 Tax=Scytonema sp. PCC 10023 TaxID=1680591 RepID=UPI0039C68260
MSALLNIEAKVNEYIDANVEVHKFSGSVLIVQKDKVLVSNGYGMANYELDVPNTPQTKFRLASITKQFTAMAIMQLQEKGLLNVDDSINKYILDYPETGKQITIHHLLTHTSGIPNFTSFPDYLETMMIPAPLEKIIASQGKAVPRIAIARRAVPSCPIAGKLRSGKPLVVHRTNFAGL